MTTITLKDLQDKCWQLSEDSGWHEPKREFGTLIALAHSELSEALDEARGQHVLTEVYYEIQEDGRRKPCGVPSELADTIVRVLDTAAEIGIEDLTPHILEKLEYNRTRGQRHGGKAF